MLASAPLLRFEEILANKDGMTYTQRVGEHGQRHERALVGGQLGPGFEGDIEEVEQAVSDQSRHGLD